MCHGGRDMLLFHKLDLQIVRLWKPYPKLAVLVEVHRLPYLQHQRSQDVLVIAAQRTSEHKSINQQVKGCRKMLYWSKTKKEGEQCDQAFRAVFGANVSCYLQDMMISLGTIAAMPGILRAA
nr:hypothetical protein CFP56_34657 [Quercus suber]